MDDRGRRGLFQPRSIAVVGASPDQSRYGARCLRYLRTLGYRGEVFAVNPRYGEIDGMPCYPSVAALPSDVDQVAIFVAADAALASLREAAGRGVWAAVVCSSGFAEADAEGVERQLELARIAAAAGMAVLGPNSLGFVDLASGVTSTFTTALDHMTELPEAGRIALVSQSGALAAILFSIGQGEGIPIGRFVSTGNEAVVGVADCVEAMAHDPDIDVVLGYVEGIRNGRRLVEACETARRLGTRVVLLHVGRTESGQRAAQSHTGAMVAGHEVAAGAFERAGVVRVPDLRTLLDLAAAPLTTRPAGRRIGIVSGSGGVGVMMADAATDAGLDVAELAPATGARLRELLPAFAPVGNPVDYGPVYQDVGAVEGCLRAVAQDPNVDVVVAGLALTPRPWLDGVIEERLAAVQRAVAKPLVVSWLGVPAKSVRQLRENGVAVYDDPGRAVAVASRLAAPLRAVGSGPTPAVADRAVDPTAGPSDRAAATQALLTAAGPGKVLPEREVKALLARYGVPVTREAFAATRADAAAAAADFDGPVAVKAEGEGLVHKTDIGAVRLGVTGGDAAGAWDEVTGAARTAGVVVTGALVQEMVPPGLEVLVGLGFDPSFGPTLTVGVGGTLTEIVADTVTEVLPVDRSVALGMIGRLRSVRLFDELRGRPPRDRGALADVMVQLAELATDAGPLVDELDLNPVVVFAEGEGCVVVDAVAVVGEGPPP